MLHPPATNPGFLPMIFGDYATNEASALIRRLLTNRAEKPRTELKAFRRTLDEAIHALETALAPSSPDDHDAEITALADRLTAATTAEVDRATKQLEGMTADRAKLVAALETAQQQLQTSEEERHTLTNQLKSSAARIQAVESAIAEHNRSSHDLQVRLEASAATEATLRQQVNQAQQELGRAALPVDHLLLVFRDVAGATTITDALRAVANALTDDFTRVAVFSVKPNRLEGVYQSGFEFDCDISKVVVPLTMGSLLAEAVSSDRVKGLMARDLTGSCGIPFGGTPTCALALPVSVNHETLCVIYAVDAGRPQTDAVSVEQRVTFAELVRHYAVAHMERLTTELKRLAELHAYAKLLLDEVEYMYTADVEAGKSGSELHTRVQENLQCARQIYARRVEVESSAAASLLEERIASIAQAPHATPFGRALVALATRDHLSSQTAQAS